MPSINERILRNDAGLWQHYRNIEVLDKVVAVRMLEDLEGFFPLDIPWVDVWATIRQVLNSANRSYTTTLGSGQDLSAKGMSSRQTMQLSLDLIIGYKVLLRRNIATLLDSDIDLGIGKVSPGDVRLFKLDPLNVLTKALPGSMLYDAVHHNWNVTLFLARIC